MIRQLICAVLGHIDHGKTSLLDKIRGTAIQNREPGGITQHTGASEVPISVIKKICGNLLCNIKGEITLPGLLFIDTPGHEAFSSLRERGGSIADIAVLVLDVNEDLQPQALESIEILRKSKVPFVIALNKIDTINGWIPHPKVMLIKDIKMQRPDVQAFLEQRLYSIVNQLSSLGFNSERFDRVKDFTKEIAIVPTSAITGEGVPELLMVLTGLGQRYLENSLKVDLNKPAEGSVLEVKELRGIGTTLDIIIYDGTLREGDIIVIGGIDGPIVSKARVLLRPAPLQDTREKGDYVYVKEVKAAAGVKISGPNLENAVSGVPLLACWDNKEIEQAKKKVQEQIKKITFSNKVDGLIIKGDTLGSLEALTKLFSKYKIRKAEIGDINKKDVIEAIGVKEKCPEYGVIIGFNVNINQDALEMSKKNEIKIFKGNIIYTLLKEFEEYLESVKEKRKREALSSIVLPAKIEVLRDHIFRISNPAIIGVEVLEGTIMVGQPLMNERLKPAGRIRSIRKEEEVLSSAKKGDRVSISIEGGVVGRNIIEGGILYSNVSENDFHKMKTELKKYLRDDEIEAMREILKLHRQENPMWGF